MTTAKRDPRLPRHDAGRAAAYLESGSWSSETTVARFRSVVAEHGDRDAVAGLDGTMTYAELDERTDQIGAWLVGAGLPVGGAVVVQVGNSTETVVAFYALLKAGAVPVAALAAHRMHEIGHISGIVSAAGHLVDARVGDGALVEVAHENAARHSSVTHLLTIGPAPEGFVRLFDVGRDIPAAVARTTVDTAQANIDHQDVAVFQLSGGTTGTPKVIPRLHAEYWNQALHNSRWLERTADARTAHVLPVLHNAGVINALLGAHAVGGCVIPLPFGGADDTLSALVDLGATDMMIGAPMEPWLDHPRWDELARTLMFLIYSGSRPPAAVADRVEAQGIWLGQTWGMAEGPYSSTRRDAPAALRAQSVGTPSFAQDDDMMIVDPITSEPLPDGETGMLAYRGPGTLAGYYDAPEHNQVAFTPDGYLLTGDMARLIDHDGVPYISLEGRFKDVISRGGEKFSTEEVEKLLRQHPAIAEAAVVAMPDARLGERACAYVALADAASSVGLADVQLHFAALGVAKFKWPERVEVVDVLPRTATYKIDKLSLRRRIVETIEAEAVSG